MQGYGGSASPEQRRYRDNGDSGSNDRRNSLSICQDQDKKVIDELVHRIGRLEQIIRDKDREKDNTESYERKESLERRDLTPGRRERRVDSQDLEARMSHITADVEELSEQVTSNCTDCAVSHLSIMRAKQDLPSYTTMQRFFSL